MQTAFKAEIPPNLLARDGEVRYFGAFVAPPEADRLFAALNNEIDWQPDRVKLYGREIVTRRKMAWHGDAPYHYTYAHHTRIALPWTPSLAALKRRVETVSRDRFGDRFNCCLLNLYHSGDEGMGWHTDDEKELQPQAAIASVSLGAPRRFILRHKTDKQKCETLLEHGSLLLMRGATQTHWEHSLPVMKRVRAARINLTFRMMANERVVLDF